MRPCKDRKSVLHIAYSISILHCIIVLTVIWETCAQSKNKESSKIDNVEDLLSLCSKCFQAPPSSLLTHPLPTCPQFFANPRCAPLLAHFFARLFDLYLEKERKQLLRKLKTPGLYDFTRGFGWCLHVYPWGAYMHNKKKFQHGEIKCFWETN